MPNRILKESICTSEEIDRLTPFEEVFFYRLLVQCDDYGRLDARPKVLSSKLFPLKDVRLEQIENALQSLASAELVSLYEVGGKPFLQTVTWERHQQIRAHKSKYPGPDGSYGDNRTLINDSNRNQMQSDDIRCNQMKSDDSNGNQMQSDDSICSRNRNRTRTRNREAEDTRTRATPAPLISDEEALRIQADLDEVLDALRDAGFPQNEKAFKRYTDLLHEHGKPKMLEAVEICVDHSVSKLDYLKAVLAGMGKDKKTGNTKLDDEKAQWEAIVRTQQESTWGVQQ